MSTATGYRTLHSIIGEEPLPPPTVRRDGWAVRVPADTYRTGPLGTIVAAVRLRRHRFAQGPPHALQQLAAEVGLTITGDAILGRGGDLLIMGEHGRGKAVMRVATRGSGDLSRHRAALKRFGEVSPVVPSLLAELDRDGVTATVEQRLPGRAPRRVTASLVMDLVAATAQLERAAGTTGEGSAEDSTHELVERVLELLPAFEVAEIVRPLGGWAADRLRGVAAGFQHGDLWHRNLLTAGSTLTGVLDWDAWRDDGLPQVDRMTLLMTWLRLRQGQASGSAVAARIWRSDPVLLTAARMGPADPDAVGIVTWLTGLAGTVERMPRRGRDHDWIARSVLSARPALDWADAAR